MVEEPPEAEAWAPRPTYVTPIIVDLPEAAVREVRSIAAVAEPAVVLAEPVKAAVEEIVIEPVAERTPSPPRSRPCRRAPEAPRHREPRPMVEVETEIGVAPEPVEEPVVEAPVVEAPVVEAPVVGELPEEPEPAAQPEVGDPVPVAKRAWQPSNPVWRERVFNSAHTRRETVTWPRPRPANGDFRGR